MKGNIRNLKINLIESQEKNLVLNVELDYIVAHGVKCTKHPETNKERITKHLSLYGEDCLILVGINLLDRYKETEIIKKIQFCSALYSQNQSESDDEDDEEEGIQ
jgi:hypothetical protein